MKRASSLFRTPLVLALLAVFFSWTPHESAEAVHIDTAVLAVGARVDQRCGITTLPLAFGTYDIADPTPLDATGVIHINCGSSLINFIMHLRLGQGQNPAPGSTAAAPLRRMANFSNPNGGYVRYNLYRNAARTQTWGDTVGTALFPGFGPYPADFNVYGRIPAQQSDMTALPGSYSDQVDVALWF